MRGEPEEAAKDWEKNTRKNPSKHRTGAQKGCAIGEGKRFRQDALDEHAEEKRIDLSSEGKHFRADLKNSPKWNQCTSKVSQPQTVSTTKEEGRR